MSKSSKVWARRPRIVHWHKRRGRRNGRRKEAEVVARADVVRRRQGLVAVEQLGAELPEVEPLVEVAEAGKAAKIKVIRIT